MPGEIELRRLLQDLRPALRSESYVFCTLKGAIYGALNHTRPLAAITEAEGLTLIIPKEEADREGLSYEATFRCITLQVHSSLEAVGLTAAVAQTLAAHQISANMLAGYHHDHLLVPADDAEETMRLLLALSTQA